MHQRQMNLFSSSFSSQRQKSRCRRVLEFGTGCQFTHVTMRSSSYSAGKNSCENGREGDEMCRNCDYSLPQSVSSKLKAEFINVTLVIWW